MSTSRTYHGIVLGASMLALALNAVAAEAPRKAGELVIETVTLTLSETEKVQCEMGTLYVPENRSEPTSRIIGVGFARIKATAPTNVPPIFHLPGGPGTTYIPGPASVNPHTLRYRTLGDVVILDQRGFSRRGETLKYSYRTADQPLDQPASLARSTAETVRVFRDAVAHFTKAGVDLRGYTVKECAADVNDLRKALGYDKIILVGSSFGSQWSFAVMRLYPEIVARALLSAVEPLDNGYDMPTDILAATQRIWKEAEQDKALQPYLPPGGIQAAAKAVLQRLSGAPVKGTVKDPKSNETATVTLGTEDFQRDFLRKAPDGPAWILSLYHEHYDAWAASVLAKRRSHSDDLRIIGPSIDTSLGVTPARERRLNSDPAIEFLGKWNWDSDIASAEIWPSADVGDDFRVPVETPIPVLFAEGNWDTGTPVENTLEIVKSFPKGRVLIAERGGHGVLEPIAQQCPKVWDELLNFLRTGEMSKLPERVTLSLPKFAVPDFPAPAAK